MKKTVLLLLVVCSQFATAQNKVERLDSLFNAASKAGTFNGNVLVAEQGKVIYENSFGVADEQTKQPIDLETIFELASVSKQFTATGIVLLKKQGKLDYDDKVSKYIPELGFYEGVTIRHLLNHTGGIPDYMELFEKYWDKSKIASNPDVINLLSLHKPAALFAPNQKFEYSNTGYALLATIIERASGQSFGDFLNKQVFKPLKMTRTLVYRSRFAPQKVANYARGYVSDSNGKKILPDHSETERLAFYLDGIVGDGTVNSTLHDLLKWDRALYTNKLLNESDKALMYETPMTLDGKRTSYGFGFGVGDHAKYGKLVSHSGGWAGYISYIDRHIDTDKTVIMLQNNMLPESKNPIKEVRKILYNEGLAVPKLVKFTPSPADLEQYTGVYSNPAFPLKITIKPYNGALTAQATGQSAFPMDAFENHTFTFDMAGIKMVFKPSENTMLFKQGANELTFVKE